MHSRELHADVHTCLDTSMFACMHMQLQRELDIESIAADLSLQPGRPALGITHMRPLSQGLGSRAKFLISVGVLNMQQLYNNVPPHLGDDWSKGAFVPRYCSLASVSPANNSTLITSRTRLAFRAGLQQKHNPEMHQWFLSVASWQPGLQVITSDSPLEVKTCEATADSSQVQS